MPNPDFTGTVSPRRCETCVHWHNPLPRRWGLCKNSVYHVYGIEQPLGSAPKETIEYYSTDLSVCSDWTRKASEAE